MAAANNRNNPRESPMSDVLHTLNGGQVIAFVAIVAGVVFLTATSLASIIAPHWRRAKQVEAETQLKRELVAAGYRAEEIERVVRASSTGMREAARVRA